MYIIIFYHTAPSEPPQLINIFMTSSREVVIRWSAPRKAFRNGIITGYSVEIKPVGANITYARNSTTTSLIVSELLPFTSYSCRVAARTIVGIGPFSRPVSFLTNQEGKDEKCNN